MSLHAKLADVMAEVERIPKRGRAPASMGGFEFVQVGDAADAIRTALASRGVSMLPTAIDPISEAEHQTKSGGTMTTSTVRVTWTLTDSETGESAVIQSMGTGADTGDKFTPKAQTNAMKYALLMGFLLSTGEDPELTDVSDRRRRATQAEAVTEPVAEAIEDAKRLATHAKPIGDGGLIGDVEVRKPPADLNLRQNEKHGWTFGFGLTGQGGRVQVIAYGDLAAAIHDAGLVAGERAQVWGKMEDVEWTPKGSSTPRTFQRLHVERIRTAEYELPAQLDTVSAPIWPEDAA